MFKIKFTIPRFKTGNAVEITRAKPDKPPAAISLLNKKKYKPPAIRNDPNKINRYFFIFHSIYYTKIVSQIEELFNK